MNSLPTWATWSIVAAAALSPVLAFLMAIAVEILIDSDAGWRACTPRLRGRWRARLLTVSQAAGPAARKRPTRNVSSAPNFCQGEFTVRQRCLAADRCGRLPPEPCGPRRGNPGGGDTGVSEMGDRGIGGCPIASLSSLQQQAMAESSRFHDLRAEGAFSDRRRRQLIAGAVTDFSSNTAASGRPSPCEPPIGSRIASNFPDSARVAHEKAGASGCAGRSAITEGNPRSSLPTQASRPDSVQLA